MAPACPYGSPGDRLWVKETWAAGAWADLLPPSMLRDAAGPHHDLGLRYAADGTGPAAGATARGRTRSAIHMPRWASRLTLEITAVRIERLQEIGEADARAEGVPGEFVSREGDPRPHAARYRTLWESIHGAGSWQADPLVWVVRFETRSIGRPRTG